MYSRGVISFAVVISTLNCPSKPEDYPKVSSDSPISVTPYNLRAMTSVDTYLAMYVYCQELIVRTVYRG